MNDFLQSLRNGQAEKPRTPKTRKNVDNAYQYSSTPRFHSYGGYQNRNQQMKRPPHPGIPQQNGNQLPVEEVNMTLLADILDNLTCHIENMVKNQEYMVSIQERSADMMERQAIAIERIVDHLNLAPDMGFPDMEETEEEDAQPAFENHYVTARKSEEDRFENRIEPIEEPVTRPEIMVQPLVTELPSSLPGRPVIRKRKKITENKVVAPKPQEAELMPREEVMDIIQTMRDAGATFDQVAKRLIELGQPTFSGRGEWHAQTVHRLCSKK